MDKLIPLQIKLGYMSTATKRIPLMPTEWPYLYYFKLTKAPESAT
jgi:hypothetical protein